MARRTIEMPTVRLLGVAGLILLSGCYYDVVEELYPSACDTGSVTWSGTIQPLVQTRCAISSCHESGATSIPDLSTYNGVFATFQNGTLRTEVVVDRTMPSGSSLSTCQIQQFDAWIAAGAPNN